MMTKLMTIKKFKKIAYILLGLSLLTGGVFLYKMPVRMVSLDVGPQVEYWSNYFGIVVKVKGIGPEGEALITESMKQKIVNQNIGDAINTTLNTLRKSNVINYEQPTTLVVAVTGENTHTSTLQAAGIKEMIESKAKRLNWPDVEIRVLSLTKKQWDVAKLSELSPGRYYILHNISDKTVLADKSKFDFNQYALLSIRELLDLENKLMTEKTVQPALATVAVSTTSSTTTKAASTTTKAAPAAPVKAVVKAPVSSGATSGIDAITSASPKQ